MRGNIRKTRFSDFSIRKKITCILLLVIGLLTIAGSVVFYSFARSLYFDSVKESMKSMNDQTREELQNSIRSCYYTSYIVQNSEEIQKIVRSETDSFEQAYLDMTEAKMLLDTWTMPVSICRISLYVDDDLFYSNDNSTFRKKSELDQYEEVKTLEDSTLPYVWVPKEEDGDGSGEIVSFIRKIGDDSGTFGYQKVSIQIENLMETVESAAGIGGGLSFLYDEKYGELLCASEEDSCVRILDCVLEKKKLMLADLDWVRIRSGSESFYAYGRRVRGTDWYLFTVLPMGILYRQLAKMFLIWLTVILLVGGLALFLAFDITGGITKRIGLLERHMSQLAHGEFHKMDAVPDGDEIGRLTMHYNETTDLMLTEIRKKYEAEELLRDARFRALQAQINPHFLYNTMDLIYWEALQSGAGQVADIVQNLAAFYRRSLSGGRDNIPIGDELEHVMSYVEIQNYRFDYETELNMMVSEDLRSYTIPKITLQPLIENAFQHGFAPLEDKSDTEIEIYGWKEEGDIVLQISDNGVGMEEEQMQKIFRKPESESLHGYGVYNIQERLQTYYGEGYGLRYESTPGEGTTVFVRIRAEREDS